SACLRTESAARQPVFEAVAVVTRRLALAKPEDVGKAEQDRSERERERIQKAGLHHDDEDEEERDTGPDASDEPPKQIALQSPSAPLGIRGRIGVAQSEVRFHLHAYSKPCGRGFAALEVANTHGGI